MLKEKILNRKAGIITYGITPPKQNNHDEKIMEISQKQIERIHRMEVDALIVYDIQEETDRTDQERPFPFLPTVDPVMYSSQYLKELELPKIICCCIGKYTPEQLSAWISSNFTKDKYSVFVGPSSSKQEVKLGLLEAYKICGNLNPDLLLGGIVIPERHMKKDNEHIKVTDKIRSGCKFFISQAVYNVEASKNFMSDYYYFCIRNEIEMVPIIFTFSPCGSLKSLEFMKWLGISIPKWLENDLLNSEDILDKSVRLSEEIFSELLDFAREKDIPIGCNIESISIRKVEIDASMQLHEDLKGIIARAL
jgi:hypothetical protein